LSSEYTVILFIMVCTTFNSAQTTDQVVPSLQSGARHKVSFFLQQCTKNYVATNQYGKN